MERFTAPKYIPTNGPNKKQTLHDILWLSMRIIRQRMTGRTCKREMITHL